MLDIIKSFIAAISTYSKIPMPNVNGEEKSFRFTIAFFPFVGVIIYGLLYLWMFITNKFEFDRVVFLLGIMIIIVMTTGGIHVDGLMDVFDAKCSYGDTKKKLEILKDPHIGAFSVIKLLEYVGVFFAGLLLIKEEYMPALFLMVIFSRILSGLSVCLFNGAKESGMIAYIKRTASKGCVPFLCIQFLIALITCILFFGIRMLIPVFASAIYFGYYRYRTNKDFGGITGDTSGYFLCMTELIWVLVFAVLSVVSKWI